MSNLKTMSNLKIMSNLKTMGVAFLVALVCSIVVSFTAVTLKPLQDANRLRESAASLVEVMETLGLGMPKPYLVERVSGLAVKKNPKTFSELDSELDIAHLGQVEDVLMVYELRSGGKLELVILPIRGAGYQSMLHGYLALKSDLNTVAALTFHQQEETPGMGARIVEKKWQALWKDKHIADESGIIRMQVVKDEAQGPYEVDGISGATKTGQGVNSLVKFWFGPDGYGPYISRLKREAG